MMEYKDFQLLLYVPEECYDECIDFYGNVLGMESFYGWDEGVSDRGQKFHAAGGQIVVLTQENPFPEYGPAHFQLEVPDAFSLYESLAKDPRCVITQTPFTRSYGWQMFRVKDPAGNHINLYTVPGGA